MRIHLRQYLRRFQSISASNLSVPMAWIGCITYAFEIYYDFSGYSDMAIGLSRMFGFELKKNFDHPYVSRSVTEFWRRWHISLSSFFRDYVYIPLGGSRGGDLLTVRNMLIVWALTGIWHGASWNYILWGLYFFVFLVLERFCVKEGARKTAKSSRLDLCNACSILRLGII